MNIQEFTTVKKQCCILWTSLYNQRRVLS